MVKGIDRLHAKMARIKPRLEAALRVTLENEARQLVAQMKSVVPVDEGDLRESINHTFGQAPKGSVTIGTVSDDPNSGLRITIYAGGEVGSADAFYARFVEFGTRKMVARPFFFPVYRANKRRVRAAITRAVNKEIKAIGPL